MADKNSDQESVSTLKAKRRTELRALRQAISPGARKAAHQTVANLIAAEPQWQSSRVIAGYIASRNEFDVNPLLTKAFAAGKEVVLPRVIAPGEMVFCYWEAGDPIERANNGVFQPTAKASTVEPVVIDWFLVPLVGCDRQGVRLGQGGGYYDRILQRARRITCGVGYAKQFVDSLPAEAHDVKLTHFVSEDGLVAF